MPRPTRSHMAVVIAGATLATFAFLVLQVFLPFTLGLWGLVAVAALDLGVYLAYRHRKAVRRTPRGYVLTSRGLEEGAVARRHAKAEAKHIVGIVFVVVFVLGLYAGGWVLEVEAMVHDSGLGPYLLGAVVSLIGWSLFYIATWDVPRWGWREIQREMADDA